MVEKIFIISFLVFGIYCTMQDEMIFEKVGNFFERTLGEFWCKPVSCCVICMTFWYGSVIYILLYRVSVIDWAVTVVASMGLNYILTKLFDDD